MLKDKVRRALLAAVLLWAMLLPARPALAASPGQTVFVAGNPDLYPIEFYDPSAKEYRGLMPKLYKLLAQRTGYTFVYINGGSRNAQTRMAKNGQAEVVSAHLVGEIDARYLHGSQPILTVDLGAGEQTVYIAFSEIASERQKSDLTRALGEISTEQKLSLLASCITESRPNYSYVIWNYVLAGISVVLLTVVIVMQLQAARKRRTDRKDSMIDKRYGIGNDKYYVYCFNTLLSDKSRSLYYLTYIAFDAEAFGQRYGGGENKQIHRYVSEFLSRKTGAVDYLALMSEGVFLLLFQASRRSEAEERVSSTMAELGEYLCTFRREYAGLFRAGVCMLAEDPGYTAETAVYSAKQGYLRAVERGVPYGFCTKKIIGENRQKERLNQQAVQAILDGEFQIYLQYIVDRTGRIYGAEAVSRWHHPQEGVLYPGKYIQMINQSGTMTMHDFYIFEQVCRQLQAWNNSGWGDLRISCNFTRYSITGADFTDRLKEILDRYEFRRENLIIELTEDSLSYDAETMARNVERCKSFGVRVALDDIGSGYSALSDLSHYPIDFVKVDRDIVIHADTEWGELLLQGLIQLSHSMHIGVLCEGVETSRQNKTVLDAGCDFIQGYYYARPLPQREAERFLERCRRDSGGKIAGKPKKSGA